MMPKWWIKQGQPLEIFEQSYLSRIHKLFGSIKRKLEKSEITRSEMFTGRRSAANWQTNGWRLLQPLVSVHSLPVPLLFLSCDLRLGEMLPLHFSVKFYWCFFFSPEFRYCSLGKIKGVSWKLQKLLSHSCSAQWILFLLPTMLIFWMEKGSVDKAGGWLSPVFATIAIPSFVSFCRCERCLLVWLSESAVLVQYNQSARQVQFH